MLDKCRHGYLGRGLPWVDFFCDYDAEDNWSDRRFVISIHVPFINTLTWSLSHKAISANSNKDGTSLLRV